MRNRIERFEKRYNEIVKTYKEMFGENGQGYSEKYTKERCDKVIKIMNHFIFNDLNITIR